MTDRSKYKPGDKIEPRPVLTEMATMIFGMLAQDADVWEYGSGGSTLWLAERAAKVISIEDDPVWYAAVTEALSARGLTNTEVHLRRTRDLPHAIDDSGLYDIVFVDCLTNKERERSIPIGAKHVKPGGWLIADDYDFSMVARAVKALEVEGWSVAIVSGTKMHPVREVPVKTSAAFCHKPQQERGS